MTYSKDKIAGRSVADAIDVICNSITPANRWTSFRGCIELSEGQIVSVGGDYMQGAGYVDPWAPKPQKTQDQMDAEAYAVALRPMVDDLAAGKLVATFWGTDSLDAKPFPAHAWKSAWKLIVDGQRALLRLLNGSGQVRGEYELLPLHIVSLEPPCAAAEHSIGTKTDVEKQKGKPGRKEIDDSDALARLVVLIKSRHFPSIAKAVEALLSENVVKVDGASPRAKYERLRKNLDKSHFVDEGVQGVTLTPRVPA